MNTVVELVNAWAKYEHVHPGGDINDFCHFYITDKRAGKKSKKLLAGNLPPDSYSALAKMMGRLTKLHNTYSLIVLKEFGLSSFDEFLYLNSIGKSEAPRKTKVVYDNFSELSSGLLILDRIKKKGLIAEEEDGGDKRSKRLRLTKKGTTLLDQCYKKMRQLNEWFFGGISKEDSDLCIHLLSDIEVNFSSRWLEDKEKSFDILSKEMK
jgi:predicted transcriptional regulator